MFESLADHYEEKNLYGAKHSRIARYEILYQFIESLKPEKELGRYRDLLIYDLYLRENVKSRPYFASDQTAWKEEIKPLYDGYFRRHRQKDRRMVHIERMEDGRKFLFDYEERDPIDYNGKAQELSDAGEENG